MILEDLFPHCLNPKCGGGNDYPHKHILPAQRELIESEEKYVASIGGYGSGKTVAGAGLALILSQVPHNRGIVVRRTYDKLHDSAQRAIMEAIQRVGWNFVGRRNRDGWKHTIIFPNESEIHFYESKDPGRYLGPEYGWFWIEEGQEEPRTTFTGLQSRLRLPAARKYLKGFVTSNPPNRLHWINDVYGAEPGVKTQVIDGITTKYRRIWSPARENPNLPESYIADLKASLPPSEVERVLEGKTTFQFEGKGVYSSVFRYDKHVRSTLEPLTTENMIRPMERSWDFNYHRPAVLWHQFNTCLNGKVHWRVLEETRCQDVFDPDLCLIVKDVSRTLFPTCIDWTDIGDAAGAEKSHKGPGPIIRLAQPPYSIRFKYRKLPNIDPGIQLIHKILSTPKCACGEEVFQIHSRCQTTIEMLAGGYHYAKERYDREISIKPIKDGLYDNYADSLRYEAEIGYRWAAQDHAALDRMLLTQKPQDLWTFPGADRDPLVGFPWTGAMRQRDLTEAEKQRQNYEGLTGRSW